ncbi:MAG: Holliday junction branch migration DNA helicase RuvB, partial [Sphaerospermopsis kisseleviana]
MTIISSKKQPPEPNGQPQQRSESPKASTQKAPPQENILQPEATVEEEGKQEESIRPQRFAD